MKKILFILIFCFLFLNVHSFEGKVVKEKFKVKSLTVDLPSNGGEWKLIRYRGKKVYNAFFNSYFLAEFKNGIISEFVEIFEGKGEPDYPMLTSQFFYNLLYNANKIRGCQERLEYYILIAAALNSSFLLLLDRPQTLQPNSVSPSC